MKRCPRCKWSELQAPVERAEERPFYPHAWASWYHCANCGLYVDRLSNEREYENESISR